MINSKIIYKNVRKILRPKSKKNICLFKSNSKYMKINEYYVSISASIKDANILDKKVFVNNILYLFIFL